MKLGMLVRADARGLGIQSSEFHRHLKPDVTVCIDMGIHTPYVQHFEQYPDAVVAKLDQGHLHPYGPVVEALRSCDVVVSHETFYDPRLVADLRKAGTRTAVQANWEFFRWTTDKELDRPDLFISPSTWYLNRWPEPTVYLPTPVATDRLRFERRTEAKTFLHVAGHRAMQDRNGTRMVVQAARYVRSGARLVIRSQSRLGRSLLGPDKCEVIVSNLPNYWDLYEDADVLVLPRRFGGQALSVNEALACGMPVIALDCEPLRRFLPVEGLVRARRRRQIRVQPGEVDWFDASPRDLAAKIDALANDPELVQRLSISAGQWAAQHSWDVLLPRWRETLEAVAAGRVPDSIPA